MEDNIEITFLGAAETVTGSKFLVQSNEGNVLIDCGLFQGEKELRELNWSDFPVDVETIDIILLTHGHLDHCGYLPRLVRMGYKGKIMATHPTLDIATVIITDTAKIQEYEAQRANKEGYSKHNPAEPLYNLDDVANTIDRFSEVEEDVWITLTQNIKVKFRYNGHIIGSTFIEMDIKGKRIVFSGDIGRKEDFLMRSPKKPEKADVLILESTYGNKNHPVEDVEEKIQQIVLHTIEKKGTLIIPSFAVERAQTLMYILWQLVKKNKIPHLPMIIDSPMAANVIKIFLKHNEWHKLNSADCIEMCEAFRIVKSFKETWEVIDMEESKIVIAGSGMITGGRVLNYLEYYLDRPETSILLAGYQANGTRGRDLLEGAKELKIFGKHHKVQAEVFNLEVLSAHADQSEILDWTNTIKNKPEKVFLVHGEIDALNTLREKLKSDKKWNAEIPSLNETTKYTITN